MAPVEYLRRAAALARFNLHAHSPDGCDDERRRLYRAATDARLAYEQAAGENAPILPAFDVDPNDDMLTALNDIATRIRTRTAA